jgi:hypothetical protein
VFVLAAFISIAAGLAAKFILAPMRVRAIAEANKSVG